MMQVHASHPRLPATTTAFARGWLATTREVASDAVSDWDSLTFGPLAVRVDPARGWASATDSPNGVLLLGDVVDVAARMTNRAELARTVLRDLRKGGVDAAIRRVAYFGGHFACLLLAGTEVTALPDCGGTSPIFWSASGQDLVLGSHAHLLGEITGSELDPIVEVMRRARDLGARGTIYFPGMKTPFRDVHPVLPNHLLTWRPGSARHHRFYPFPDTELERDPSRAYETFHDAFMQHVRSLCSFGRIGISLTGGLDSRASLAAAYPHLSRRTITWTYYNFATPDRGHEDDLIRANRIARRARIAHQVVGVGRTQNAAFDSAYLRTFRHTPQFRALAAAYMEQLPRDIIELQSMVAEVGTGFYKNRYGQPTPERLAQLYARGPFGEQPEIVEAMAEYRDAARLTTTQIGPIDFHDLLYWETRVGRWACLRIQEVELAHRILFPFNSRAVVEALQGPPLERRVHKQPLARFVRDHPTVSRSQRVRSALPLPVKRAARRILHRGS